MTRTRYRVNGWLFPILLAMSATAWSEETDAPEQTVPEPENTGQSADTETDTETDTEANTETDEPAADASRTNNGSRWNLQRAVRDFVPSEEIEVDKPVDFPTNI